MDLNREDSAADAGGTHAEPDITAGARLAAVPAASVVVLNFNGAAIIGRCLEHLLAQSFADFEIVAVDNGSTDDSVAVMEPYLRSARLSIVRSPRNLGVAAGRNLGAWHARGRIVAFVDNDGYPHPRWLEEIMAAFAADSMVGAVGSLVFFDANKSVLNSAGGTANFQGYGGDRAFNTPYEFADLRREILYPMGCGMAVRSDVLRGIGPLDRHLFNYYDDFELGVRVWKSGFKVVLAPDAWIDHGFGSADQLLGNKAILCERNRVRTVLKYFPATHLPRWAWRELAMWRATEPRWRGLASRAYLWNLLHLPSALALRLRFACRRHSFRHLIEQRWGRFPPTIAENRGRADAAHARAWLDIDGDGDATSLIYGWWPAQFEDGLHYRWTAAQAAALFRFKRSAYGCGIRLMSATPAPKVHVAIRKPGQLKAVAQARFAITPGWQTCELRCRLSPGDYELLLRTEPPHTDVWGRTVGVAIASIRFA